MIQGLRLRVTHYELKQHCMARSAYHHQRAEEKESRLPELEQSLEIVRGVGTDPSNVGNMSKGVYRFESEDPIKDLKQDIRDHKNKALVFGFFAEHLFDDDYELREDDLVRLEIVRR